MRKILLIVCLLVLWAGSAWAGGFAIYEFGTRASSLSGAVVAQAHDASSIFYNPSGLAFLNGTQVYGNLTLITASNKWVGPEPLFADKAFDAVEQLSTPIGFFLSHSLSDRLAMGIGVTNPFGLALKWPGNFPGDVISRSVNLKSFYISPVVAFKVFPFFSIGGGPDLVYSNVKLERAILFPTDSNPGTNVGDVTLDGNSNMDVGFSASFLFKLEELSVGFMYRHHINAKISGDADFNINDEFYKPFLTQTAGLVDQSVSTEITYPSFFSVGAHYKFFDKLGAEFDYMWYKWSSFQNLTINFANLPSEVIKEDYSNSSQYRLGLLYDLTDQLELRVGYINDRTPQPRGSVSPLLPDNNRNDFSFGVGYKLGSMQFDLGYMFVDFGERSTVVNGVGQNFSGFNGTYASKAYLVFMGYGVTF